jgi:hypothetical protein
MGQEAEAMKLLGRTRDEFARTDHGEAADWVKFFDEHDIHSMFDTIHTALGKPPANGTDDER